MSEFVFFERGGKLVGARSISLAFDTRQEIDYFVYVFTLNEFGDALKVAAAAADEFDVDDFVVFGYVEQYLSATSTFG